MAKLLFLFLMVFSIHSVISNKEENEEKQLIHKAPQPRHILVAKLSSNEKNKDDQGYLNEAFGEEVGPQELNPSENLVSIPFTSGTLLDDDGKVIGDIPSDDEIMETADNIVFKPLFRYRKQSVEKRRVFRDRNGNISKKPESTTRPPVSQKPPPPVLVYDRVSGAYYPQVAPSSAPYYPYYPSYSAPYTGYQGYPGYYQGTPTSYVRRN